jgi:DNA-binding winged helix-turn-helix (wHTH) protein
MIDKLKLVRDKTQSWAALWVDRMDQTLRCCRRHEEGRSAVTRKFKFTRGQPYYRLRATRAIARQTQTHQIALHEDRFLLRLFQRQARLSRSSALSVAYRHLSRLAPVQPRPAVRAMQADRSPHADQSFLERRTGPGRIVPTEISFGPFRLLPSQFLLLERDKPVQLGSRALEILVALLERPGELITKQELLARVWPNIFVEPANLTVHVSALRRTLRDGRDGNRFIINVPGRGYLLVADVTAGVQRP